MKIDEAVMATTPSKPFIRRKSWGYLTETPTTAVKILPTNSPDGCVIRSVAEKNIRYGWRPTANDLIADDWEVTGL